jgi:hypothetical protein
MIPSLLADILWYALPVLALVTLVLGIRWRGKSPAWLPLVAALAPLGTIALMLDTASIDPAGWEQYRGNLLPPPLAALALLVLAAVFLGRRWRGRGILLLAGLSISAAFGVLMLAVQLA